MNNCTLFKFIIIGGMSYWSVNEIQYYYRRIQLSEAIKTMCKGPFDFKRIKKD